MTRRSHVSFILIFNTPSPYQETDDKIVDLRKHEILNIMKNIFK